MAVRLCPASAMLVSAVSCERAAADMSSVRNASPRRLSTMAVVLGVALVLLAQWSPAAEQSKPLRTDSRAPFVHRIPIYDDAGKQIRPPSAAVKTPSNRPFSTLQTCSRCHEYDTISHGWHFNAMAGGPSGRAGEPWIYQDLTTRTVLPLSYRDWPGAHHPRDAGMDEWTFVLNFGRHMPGGGPGVAGVATTQPATATTRWHITGQLQIDCLICHVADQSHDPVVRAQQIELQNFRWATTPALGLGIVRGTMARFLPNNWDPALADDPDSDQRPGPSISYDAARFEPGEKVFFNITRRPPPERCYFCHTASHTLTESRPQWHTPGDIHLTAGLSCVDCHRNGIDHAIVRGYETEGLERSDPMVTAMSCRGCHLGSEQPGVPPSIALGGRLGAPKPLHRGLPALHLEKLSCTACHSGPWPQDHPQGVQTSMAHALGTESNLRDANTPPRISEPLFLRGADGKIAPHRAVWPNYWGDMADDVISPLAPDKVRSAAGKLLPVVQPANMAAYKPLSDEQVQQVLAALKAGGIAKVPVYVSGGMVYRIENGALTRREHPAARPYTWALGHDVRPASQSLGVRGCSDCHAPDSPIYFGLVQAQGPVAEGAVSKLMLQLRGEDATVVRAFARSFALRGLLKTISFVAAAALLLLLAAFLVRAVGGALWSKRN